MKKARVEKKNILSPKNKKSKKKIVWPIVWLTL